MNEQFHEGDRVEWDGHGGRAVGEVAEKITDDTKAVHRPDALHERRD